MPAKKSVDKDVFTGNELTVIQELTVMFIFLMHFCCKSFLVITVFKG